MSLRVLSFNIHKGFDLYGLQFTLEGIRRSIRKTEANIVLLQEVLGDHQRHQEKINNRSLKTQFEYLADEVWPHFAYGKNSIYRGGHHGNAILSEFPILYSENIDISTNRFEKRGMLHCEINLPHLSQKIHVICVHLSLFEMGRTKQIETISKRLNSHIPKKSPALLGGDFNDWLTQSSQQLQNLSGFSEIFLKLNGRHEKTFPSFFPALALDRLYYRNILPVSCELLTGGNWNKLSDHLPILGNFSLNLQREHL